VSNKNPPKIEGLIQPWQLRAARKKFVLPSAQGIKSAKHGIRQ